MPHQALLVADVYLCFVQVVEQLHVQLPPLPIRLTCAEQESAACWLYYPPFLALMVAL